MRFTDIVTCLLIVGGLNLSLQSELVSTTVGGQSAGLLRLAYVLVCLSAVWQAGRLTTMKDLAKQFAPDMRRTL